MPELPEVETIVRELKKKISGTTLRKFLIFDKRIGRLRIPLPLKIINVSRHGKYIVFDTGKGKILFHLRMTGSLLTKSQQTKARSSPSKYEKYERAQFEFTRGERSRTAGDLVLKFIDPRRFGTIKWENGKLPEMGFNPLGREFNAENFKNILRARSRAIKSFLLDQKLVAGLGNIYADESLWLAKINPLRKSDSLSVVEIRHLADSIKNVLREAIKRGGSTMRDYRKPSGRPGSYARVRKVYKRAGEPCPRCGKKIASLKAGGRTAHFCPNCQKVKK